MNKNKIKLNREQLSLKTRRAIPKIYLGLLIIVAVIFLGVLYRAYAPVAGQAAFMTPPLVPVNFNLAPDNSFWIKDIPSWGITLTTTAEDVSSEYLISTEMIKETGQVKYVITDSSGVTLAQGLLSEEFFDSGDIYLDPDTNPDLRLTYSEGFLRVLNLNYAEPAVAKIIVIDPTAKTVISNKIISVALNQEAYFWFNVTSNKAPLVTAAWKNGMNLITNEFSALAFGNNYTTMAFKFTPKEETAYVVKVTASVEDKIIQKNFIFGAGTVIYALGEDNLPGLVMRKKENKEEYNFTFNFKPDKDQKQPFSLPCGEFSLSGQAVHKVATIYAYDQSVQQWKEDVPSEFDKLEWKKGYLLQLKADEPFSLTGSCNMESEPQQPPKVFGLPTLKAGWNLVGITGYEPRAIKDLIVPTGKKISYIYSLSNDGVNLKDDLALDSQAELEPGKAYWVLVE